MIDFFKQNSEITAALIAAIVSLIIAGFSGVYILTKSRTELENMRKKIKADYFTNKSAEAFWDAHIAYIPKFKYFDQKRLILQSKEDGTEVVQHIIDFYGQEAQPIISRYPDFVGKEVVEADAKFLIAVEEMKEKFAPGDPEKVKYALAVGYSGYEAIRLLYEVKPR